MDPDKEILTDIMVNEDLLLVTWKFKDEKLSKPKNYLASVTAFVTAYANLNYIIKWN